MSSTINASTASGGGVITTADASGILQLQSGGTTIMTISSTGVSTQVGAPAFSAYIVAATQTVTANAYSKVTLTGKLFDTNNNFDNTTNYRFTPTVAGYYQVNAMVGSNGGSNIVLCAIYKNGVNYNQGSDTRTTGNCQSSVACDLIFMNGSTDYIELYAYNTATSITGGSPAAGIGASPFSTRLSAFLARSA